MPASITHTEADERAEYIRGLRALADILEAHPDFDLPFSGSAASTLSFIPVGASKRQAALFARLIPGTVAKQPRGSVVDLVGSVHGLHVKMIAERDEVCERVVVGTREVTEEVPDPAAPPVPTITQTRVEEIVRWECRSILADAPASDAVAEVQANAARLAVQDAETDLARAETTRVRDAAVSRG